MNIVENQTWGGETLENLSERIDHAPLNSSHIPMNCIISLTTIHGPRSSSSSTLEPPLYITSALINLKLCSFFHSPFTDQHTTSNPTFSWSDFQGPPSFAKGRRASVSAEPLNMEDDISNDRVINFSALPSSLIWRLCPSCDVRKREFRLELIWLIYNLTEPTNLHSTLLSLAHFGFGYPG